MNLALAFLSDAQGFSGSPAASTTLSWDGTVGNPAGSLKARTAGKNKNGASTWTWTGTWEDLGVPAGSTVTGVTGASMQSRCTEYSTGASSTSGPVTLTDGATTITLSSQRTGITATSGSWTTTNGVDATGLSLPSSDTISITIAVAPNTGNSTSAAVTLYQDTIAATVTYQAAAAALAGSAADVAAATATLVPEPYSDTFESDAIGAQPAGWVPIWVSRPWAVQIGKFAQAATVGTISNSALASPVQLDAAHAYTATVRVRFGAGTAAIRGGLVLHASGVGDGAECGYHLALAHSSGDAAGNQLMLRRLDAGATTVLSSPAFASTAGLWYWLKVDVDGSTGIVRAKAWADGDTEPAAWAIDLVDTAYTTGAVGVACRANNITHDFDDFSVSAHRSMALSAAAAASATAFADILTAIQAAGTAAAADSATGALATAIQLAGSVAALAAATATLVPEPYSDDFESDAIGAQPAGWTPLWVARGWAVQSGKFLQCATAGSISNTAFASPVQPNAAGAYTAAVRVRFTSSLTAAVRGGLVFHASGVGAGAEKGYHMGIAHSSGGSSGNQFLLRRLDNGATTNLATPAFTANANSWYWVKAQVNGSTGHIQGRIWLDGTQEPTTWAIDVTDTTYTTGYVGVACRANNITHDFDDFSVAAQSAGIGGAASDVVAAAGGLTTQILPAGAALVVATASGALSTGIALAGAGSAVSIVGGDLTTAIRLTAQALAQALVSAALNTGILLGGTAGAQAGASGSLAGGAAALSGAAIANALAAGDMTTLIRLVGPAAAQTLASASLTAQISFSAAAVANALAAAGITTAIKLAGAGADQATATGGLGAGMAQLAGAPAAVAAASGMLTAQIRLTAQALATALATGGITALVRFNAQAAANALASGSLAGTAAQLGGAAQAQPAAAGALTAQIWMLGEPANEAIAHGDLDTAIRLLGAAQAQAGADAALSIQLPIVGETPYLCRPARRDWSLRPQRRDWSVRPSRRDWSLAA